MNTQHTPTNSKTCLDYTQIWHGNFYYYTYLGLKKSSTQHEFLTLKTQVLLLFVSTKSKMNLKFCKWSIRTKIYKKYILDIKTKHYIY